MKTSVFLRKKKTKTKKTQKYSFIKTKLTSTTKPVQRNLKDYFRIVYMRFIFSSITAFFKKITPSRPANSKFWPPGATFSSWNRNFKVPKCCLDGRQVFSTWFLGRCGGGVMSGGLILLNCFLGIIHWLGVYCCSNIIYSSRPNWQHNFLYSYDFLKRNKTQHS